MKIQNETDIIKLIGYETILKFSFISDGMMTYETLAPDPRCQDLYNYEIVFFIEEGTQPEFFCYDSFSNFLLKYKIYQLEKICMNDNSREVLYSRKYDE